MEVISLKMESELLKEIDSSLKKNKYSTRTEFIRDSIRRRLTDLEKQKSDIQTTLDNLAKKWDDFLVFTEKDLSEEMEKAEAPLRFGATKNVFMVNGWIPTKRLKKVEDHLNKAAKNKLLIKSEELKKGEKIPPRSVWELHGKKS